MARAPAHRDDELRRLSRRFLLLVALPAVVLVGFGVLAVRDERTAVEARFRADSTQRLESLAQNLISSLQTVSERLVRASNVPSSDLIRFEFSGVDREIMADRPVDPRLAEALSDSLAASAQSIDANVSFLPIPTGTAAGLYAVRRRQDGDIAGLAFSEAGIDALVKRDASFLFTGESARFTVEAPPQSPTASVNPLMALLDGDDFERGVVSLPLPGVLADWHIVSTPPDEDPFQQALSRGRLLSVVTLFFCAIALAIGVLATLRGIWREGQLARLKTDFVSNISHEIRTPLASIRMFAETLREGRARTPEERAACLEHITRESERLTAIADRTLDWARIEAGRSPFAMQPTQVMQVVEDVVATFVERGGVSPETVVVHGEPALPEVLGDAAALGQVVLNLLENAAKYTGPDKHIEIRMRRQGKSVCIDVEDNGIGISPASQKHIFERFFRADDLLARKTEGTGLGLSIAEHIVGAHRGRLTVESKVGRGSIFTVTLPAVSSVSADSAISRSKERPA